MSRKEFDMKQFLLEKGEQVGLGVAVTLMVLMLILSLFMPNQGFFSGSPAAKAKELNERTEQLETALRTNQPKESDLPETREGKLIDLDTTLLLPDNYPTGTWFEPRMKEDKSRRPPKIYNVEEAVAKVAAVPIDTYLFRFNAKPPSILVLEDKGRKVAAPQQYWANESLRSSSEEHAGRHGKHDAEQPPSPEAAVPIREPEPWRPQFAPRRRQ